MDSEVDQDEADAVIAGLVGGAMADCPHCGAKTLSTSIFREDFEHPDEVYKCTSCSDVFEVYMPEGIVHRARTPMRGLIPFSPDGNQERWAFAYGHNRLRPNFVFEDTLIYSDSTSRGLCNHFKRKSTGTEVIALHVDFKTFIPQMVHGEITGKFTFRKRGYSCGVTFVEEKKPRAPRKYKKRTPKPKP